MTIAKLTVFSLRITVAVGALLLLASYCFANRVDPTRLRAELLNAGVIGSDPQAAANAIASVRIPRGSVMTIGGFDPKTRTMYASVSNAARRGWLVWRARVTVSFDETQRASAVSVDLISERPI